MVSNARAAGSGNTRPCSQLSPRSERQVSCVARRHASEAYDEEISWKRAGGRAGQAAAIFNFRAVLTDRGGWATRPPSYSDPCDRLLALSVAAFAAAHQGHRRSRR